jgi:aspartate aminotransferase
MAFTNRARELREQGADVVAMTAGEPEFPTAPHIKAAAIEAIEHNFTHYTQVQGILELREAIAEKFNRDNHLTFSPHHIVVSAGAKQALANALMVLCGEGDEVLVPAPYWVSYPPLVQLAGATPVVVPCEAATGFRPDPDALQRAITPRTRAIIVNTPNNPAGTVYTAEELAAIAGLAVEHDLVILSDEIYEGMLFDGRRHLSVGAVPGAEKRTITINGFSKTYAMTGWRVGYMGGPENVCRAATALQGQMTSNPNSIAQKAALAALRGPQGAVHAMTLEYQQRRDFVVSALRLIPGLHVTRPEGAMFLFIDVRELFGRTGAGRTMQTSSDVVEYLLDSRHVALVPGSGFGDDGCVRLSFACSLTDLEKGVKRIAEGIADLQ